MQGHTQDGLRSVQAFDGSSVGPYVKSTIIDYYGGCQGNIGTIMLSNAQKILKRAKFNRFRKQSIKQKTGWGSNAAYRRVAVRLH